MIGAMKQIYFSVTFDWYMLKIHFGPIVWGFLGSKM